jgi:hypothetical protein
MRKYAIIVFAAAIGCAARPPAAPAVGGDPALPHPLQNDAPRMNWLERACREIQESAARRTANSAERNLTAVMALPHHTLRQKSEGSIGSNGSTSSSHLLESESALEAYEERAAIMEFDSGLGRDEAEREAWALVSKRYRQHYG